MTNFGRLEYQTRAGWVNGHAGISLQDPQRYVDRLGQPRIVGGTTKEGVVARFVPINEDWTTGEPVIVPSAGVPDFHHASQGILDLMEIMECAACGGRHKQPWECVL
jgi:hypothetical protein